MAVLRVSREQVESLWYTRKSNDEIRAALGLTKNQLQRAKHTFDLPDRDTRRATEDPDEATIAARCLEVQARWSESERARRYAGARSLKMTTLSGRPIAR